MARRPRNGSNRRYGVGEWFGRIISDVPKGSWQELLESSRTPIEHRSQVCPFRQQAYPGANCSKQSGVCSLRMYERGEADVVPIGNFVTICPARFWQDNDVFRWVGQTILGISTPTVIAEVKFLEREASGASEPIEGGNSEAEAGDTKAVGKIDAVLIDAERTDRWCALEFQAVYFSGKKMDTHLDQFADGLPYTVPFPDLRRSPDFRSSAPKRLMPQLQIKVPTLRRWGRKMAVVVDEDFFASFSSTMTEEAEMSNCDIVWFVVGYDHSTAKIRLSRTAFTTLEASVTSLAGGRPRSQASFEADLISAIEAAQTGSRKILRVGS
jgi:hypothetical protein